MIPIKLLDEELHSIRQFRISEFGSEAWFKQFVVILKTTNEAVCIAKSGSSLDNVSLVLEARMEILLHELITAEVWRVHVFGSMISHQIYPETITVLAVSFYYECILANLLETILFHAENVNREALKFDLIDYCHRCLIVNDVPKSVPRMLQEILRQLKKFRKLRKIKALTIMGCLTQNLRQIGVAAINKMLVDFDFPMLILRALDQKVWIGVNKDTKEVKEYIDGNWRPYNPHRINKIEAQCWMALFSLVTSSDFLQKYPLDVVRIESLQKACNHHLNQYLLDQLPFLEHLKRFILELSLISPTSCNLKPFLIVDCSKRILEQITKNVDWKEIASSACQLYLSKDSCGRLGNVLEQCSLLFSHNLEFNQKTVQCSSCGAVVETLQKCGRCKIAQYCDISCQKNHWAIHKLICRERK
ncbi:hypothetical protein ACOME3_003802 [Neoechinorhynchus agilis]